LDLAVGIELYFAYRQSTARLLSGFHSTGRGGKGGFLSRSGFLNMISGMFDVTAEALDGAATRADNGE
jgi:hypothetical protein